MKKILGKLGKKGLMYPMLNVQKSTGSRMFQKGDPDRFIRKKIMQLRQYVMRRKKDVRFWQTLSSQARS